MSLRTVFKLSCDHHVVCAEEFYAYARHETEASEKAVAAGWQAFWIPPGHNVPKGFDLGWNHLCKRHHRGDDGIVR